MLILNLCEIYKTYNLSCTIVILLNFCIYYKFKTYYSFKKV